MHIKKSGARPATKAVEQEAGFFAWGQQQPSKSNEPGTAAIMQPHRRACTWNFEKREGPQPGGGGPAEGSRGGQKRARAVIL